MKCKDTKKKYNYTNKKSPYPTLYHPKEKVLLSFLYIQLYFIYLITVLLQK